MPPEGLYRSLFIPWLVIILGDMKALLRCIVSFGNANVHFQSVSDSSADAAFAKEL